MRSKTQVLIIKCLKFKIKVVKIIAIMLAPWACMPTAIIWLAPAKTKIEKPQVWATVKPACLAIMAKAMPMGTKPKTTGIPARIPLRNSALKFEPCITYSSGIIAISLSTSSSLVAQLVQMRAL